MNEERIGLAAGLLWERLRESGEDGLTLTTLKKKASGYRPDEVVAALGWLAREGKLRFENGKRGRVSVVLAEAEKLALN